MDAISLLQTCFELHLSQIRMDEASDSDSPVIIRVDTLPLKRIYSVAEDGTEEVAQPRSPKVRRLAALQEPKPEKAKDQEQREDSTSSESEEQVKEWPWGNVLNHLAMAQEQFREILDIVSHVEKGDFLALSHVSRAKLIPEEQAANLVTQVAAKQDICQKLGADFKSYAQSLRTQVAEETMFCQELDKIQTSFKLRRTRNTSANSVPKSSFFVDLSLPIIPPFYDIALLNPHVASLKSVSLSSDSGILTAEVPPKVKIRELKFILVKPNSSSETKPRIQGSSQNSSEPSGENPSPAFTYLCKVQDSLFDEMLFGQLKQEASSVSSLTPSKIEEGSLQWNVGFGTFFKAEMVEIKEEEQDEKSTGGEVEVPEVEEKERKTGFQEKGRERMLESFSKVMYQELAFFPESGKKKNYPSTYSPTKGILDAILSFAKYRAKTEAIQECLKEMCESNSLLSFERKDRPLTSLKVDQFETIWKLRFEPPNWSDASEKNPNGLLKALVNLKGESLKVTGLKANSSVEFSVNQLRALILQQTWEFVLNSLETEAHKMKLLVRKGFKQASIQKRNSKKMLVVSFPEGKTVRVKWKYEIHSKEEGNEEETKEEVSLLGLQKQTWNEIGNKLKKFVELVN